MKEKRPTDPLAEAWSAYHATPEELHEMEEWVATAGFVGPVTPEPEDFAPGTPTTISADAKAYRLAQSAYLLRRFREAKRRGWKPGQG